MDARATEGMLDGFVEGVFRLMLEHHQRHVVGMDLTLTQAQALRVLRVNALPPSKLAAMLGISAPAVTQLTNRLVRKRLIERRTIKEDRRWVNLELTGKGRLIVDQFRKRRNELFDDVLSRLTPEDRLQVIEVLSKITTVLDVGYQMGPGFESDRLYGDPALAQTAVQPPDASKGFGRQPISRPARRMKIEWD